MIAVVSSADGNVFFIYLYNIFQIQLFKKMCHYKGFKARRCWLSETLSANVLPYICRINRALRVGVKVSYF